MLDPAPALIALLIAANNAVSQIVGIIEAHANGKAVTPEQLDAAASQNEQVSQQLAALRTDNKNA